MSSDMLSCCVDDIKRRLKPFKGAQLYMRVFPNIPVTRKVPFLSPS